MDAPDPFAGPPHLQRGSDHPRARPPAARVPGRRRQRRRRVLGGHLRQRRVEGSRRCRCCKELAAAEPRYKVLSFSRNFGHQMAITAGIDRAERRRGRRDGRRPPGSARGGARDGGALARRLRRRLRRARRSAHGETRVQAASPRPSSTACCAPCWAARPIPARRRRLPADEPRRSSLTLRALREQHRFVRGMVAWVGFRQIAVALRARRRASPARRSTRCARCSASRSTASRRSRIGAAAAWRPGWASRGRAGAARRRLGAVLRSCSRGRRARLDDDHHRGAFARAAQLADDRASSASTSAASTKR